MRLFSVEEVRTIREEYVHRAQSAKNPNVIDLANRYGVSQETIRRVAKRITYQSVD